MFTVFIFIILYFSDVDNVQAIHVLFFAYVQIFFCSLKSIE